jgi:hypothetical protein
LGDGDRKSWFEASPDKKLARPPSQRTSQAWWCIPVIPALGPLRQKNLEFEASLGYIARLSQNKKRKKESEAKWRSPRKPNMGLSESHLFTPACMDAFILCLPSLLD